MSDEVNAEKETEKRADDATNEPGRAEEPLISFIVTHCNETYPFELDRDTTIGELKAILEPLTDVPVERQKLIYKETLSDDTKIGDINITEKKRKIMLMGSKRVRQTSPVTKYSKPEKVLPAVHIPVSLEEGETLTGLLDFQGKPLRMRFEQESKRIFLATPSSTFRIPLSSINEVTTIPIDEDQDYFILKLKVVLGGRLHKIEIHWIPCQYIQDIRDKIRRG